MSGHTGPTRRDMLRKGGAFAAGGATLLALRPARATPETMQAAIRQVVGEAAINKGRVALDVPPLVENGNTVPVTVVVESPMTAADRVKAIHIFNEKNPQPNVISVRLGPRAGKAAFSTRIRLADSQQVTAIAEMSDGTFWSDDELMSSGINSTTATAMGHLPVSGQQGSLSWLASLPVEHRVYVHINNTNPMLNRRSDEHRAVTDRGVQVGSDGQEFTTGRLGRAAREGGVA